MEKTIVKHDIADWSNLHIKDTLNKIILKNVQKTEEFKRVYCPNSLVTSFIKDTRFLNVKKKLAMIKRQILQASELSKANDDYDWDDLIKNGKLGFLTIANKDLNHHSPLCYFVKLKKFEKVKSINEALKGITKSAIRYFWEKRMMFLHMIHKGHILRWI